MATLTPLILHGEIFIVPANLPPIYIQLITVVLIFINLILTFYLYFKSKNFFFLFGLVIVTAIILPHILHGHLLISEEYSIKHSSTIILLLDLFVAIVFYVVHKNENKKIKIEKDFIQNDLLDSYKYIGEVNGKKELYEKFLNVPFLDKYNESFNKNDFQKLLDIITNSVAKTDESLIRFVETKKIRTLKEFCYSKENKCQSLKIPNKEIIKNKYNKKDVQIISSGYDLFNIKCYFCYIKRGGENVDIDLLKSLLKQIHLLFLFTNIKNLKLN